MQVKQLHITNFRSLRDLTTPGLTSAVVLHGANNSGKSNILLALQTIFSAKSSGTGVSLPQDMAGSTPSQPARTTPFWNGVISNFGDNFYMGSSDAIEFKVRLEVLPSHFEKINEVELLDGLLRPGHNYQVTIVGRITRQGDDGEMVLESVRLNNKFVFDRQGENVEWLPWIDPSVDSKRKQYLGEALLNSFTDSVYVVPANRYLSTEEDQGNIPSLESSSFKNWLHQQSLSREGFTTYETVRQQLKEPPFKYGDISFIRDSGSIDIMVDDGCGFRMSIAQKGTGVHQILVLLGYIATSRAYVIGIEEPELNLSFQRQDDLITTLLELVRLNTNRVSQILLSSHSDHVGSRSELKQIRVENPDGRATRVRKFTLDDRATLFPRSNKGLKRKVI
jgi:energy-coupling factor transporter ATP-binding protein EcfA2